MNLFFVSLVLATALAAAPESIRTMPVARTPEPSTVALTVSLPQNGQLMEIPVWVQFRMNGYALGAASQFERASEVAQTDMGQTVHIIVDDRPYFAVNEPAIDPFNEDGYYYDTSYKVEIPFRLKEGTHTLRMFPARSFGEGLKGENSFVALHFYVGSEKDNPKMDLSKPYLTYNEPSNQMYLTEDKPVLLDFYVTNTELSSDGYKVRLTIDSKINRTITSWQPYYIYGLKKGRHTVELELLDSQDKLVPGLFNDVKQTITIH